MNHLWVEWGGKGTVIIRWCFSSSVTTRCLVWKILPSRIKTTGSSAHGFSTLIKCWSYCVKMCKWIQPDGWQAAIVSGGVPSNNSGFRFSLWNTMSSVTSVPDARVPVTKYIVNFFCWCQVRNLFFTLHAGYCIGYVLVNNAVTLSMGQILLFPVASSEGQRRGPPSLWWILSLPKDTDSGLRNGRWGWHKFSTSNAFVDCKWVL